MDETRIKPAGDLSKRKLSRRRFLQAGVVVVGAIATGCSTSPAAPDKPAEQPKPAAAAKPAPAPTSAPASGGTSGKLRIGTIFPITGSLAFVGEEAWRGVEVARITQNRKGGVLGKEIEFVNSDAQDAAAAVSQANRLISSEKLQIIIGTYASSMGVAASEVAERNKVIHWEVSGIADAITARGFQYVFRTPATGGDFGLLQVQFCNESIAPALGKAPNQLRVAVINEDGDFGTSVLAGVDKAAKETGLNLVGREQYNSKATDLSSLVLKLKSMQPDILLQESYVQDTLLFWKQARELDFNVKAVIGGGGAFVTTDMVTSLGTDADGMLTVCFPQYEINENYGRGAKDHVKLYQELFKEKPRSGDSLTSNTGASILWEAIAKAGSTDPEALRKAALTLDIGLGQTVNGWGVKFAGPNEPNAGTNLRAKPVVSQWQNGKLLTVWPKEAAVAPLARIPWPTWAERAKR